MIYLDHAATTPLAPEVLDAMMPWLTEGFGNPSSLYHLGRAARKAVEDSREEIAAFLGAKPRELIFTSGGSESDTAAICGLSYARRDRGRHVLASAIEHPAVLKSLARLQQDGFETELLPVDGDGFLTPDTLAERLRDDTTLVCVMHANNELGTIQPIPELAAVCRSRGVPLHCDAVQSVPWLPVEVDALMVDTLAASGHKLHGPKGVGLLYLRSGVRPWPWILGGSQERSRRAGTENVAGIVGLAAAWRRRQQDLDGRAERVRGLAQRLRDGLLAIPGTRLNGPADGGLPGHLNISFERLSGESLMIVLDSQEIAVSTGSACSSGATEPSHVLLALDGDRDRAHGSLRLTLGERTTADEIETVIEAIGEAVERLRQLSPTGTG